MKYIVLVEYTPNTLTTLSFDSLDEATAFYGSRFEVSDTRLVALIEVPRQGPTTVIEFMRFSQ